jgi:hypothetical protein
MWRAIPLLLCLAIRGSPADQPPVKLDIQTDRHSARPGEPFPIRIRLLTAANAPVPAPKPLDVQLQARLPSGEVKSFGNFILARGEAEKEVSITPPGRGLIYLWAKQAELLPGGVFVSIRPPTQPAPQPSPPPANPPPQPSAKTAPEPRKPQPVEQPTLGQLPRAAAAPPPLPSVPPAIPKLALRYSPDRRFLADGNDAATVQAFLLTDPLATDLRLNLFDGSGTMKPVPLTIPKGQDTGQASLTFDQPGTVSVEFLGSEPSAKMDDTKLAIPFMPAITHLKLEASPPAISLVDRADLVLTFRDKAERPVASDVARHVIFTIDTGQGELSRQEMDVGVGQFEARTSFQPARLGQVGISAATPNLLTASIPFQVSAPVGLLVCSFLGGLAGGYLYYWKHKRSGRRQIVVGVITGFLFYWACLFLGLAAVGHAVVVNPLSAFAISAFGGWMQTGVFAFLKGRLKAQ